MSGPHPLIGEWQFRVGQLVGWGASDAAQVWEAAAKELADFERERAFESLTLTQAGSESGYSPEHLGRLIAQGRLENVGEKHAPRLRRGDLPKKPPRKPGDGPDLLARARGEG